MDHPLTSSFQGLGIVLASLLSLFNSPAQAQVISGLTAYQSGTAIVLELGTISRVKIGDLSFYYSHDGGLNWQLINDDCLSPVSSRSITWAVLDCLGVETYSAHNIRFKASTNSCNGTVGFAGYDYRIVEIGDQCWFAENLRTTHYANGNPIPGNLTDSEWTSTTSGATAVYGEGTSYIWDGSDNEVINLETYGRLYNWYAVDDSRGLCPNGWHIPTDGEWMTLEMELGMTSSEANSSGWRGTNQGAELKSTSADNSGWNGSNTSGFSAFPGGYRYGRNGFFYDGSTNGYWWCAGTDRLTKGFGRVIYSIDDGVDRILCNKWEGLSIRCLRDE